MSLHIRLFTNFWTHRKTARLRSLIGNDAYWIPPRLWSYAAENQPDGNFESYTPQELAMLIGYQGDAQALLQALQQASFLNGMTINDWSEHNGYHHKFSERAKIAAKARWAKEGGEGEKDSEGTEEGKDKKGKERKGDKQCLEHARSILILDYLNFKAGTKYQPVDGSLKHILARLREGYTDDQCKSVIDDRVREWAQDVKMSQFLRPQTLFNSEKFPGYLGRVGVSSLHVRPSLEVA